MRKTALTLALILAMAAAGAAQIPTGGNVFFGYSYSRAEVFSSSPVAPALGFLQPASRLSNFNGWQASAEGKFFPFLGVEIDLSQRYASQSFTNVCLLPPGGPPCPAATQTVNSRVITGMLGPRVSVPIGRFTPFAHALFGGAHISDTKGALNSDTSFSTAIGGGIDYKLIKGVAWRFQGDALHTRFFGAGQNNLRLSTGLVLRF